MALVKYEQETTSNQGSRSLQAWAPGPKRYPINYEKLKQLVGITGLKGPTDECSTPEAHKAFMSMVDSIFIKPSLSECPPISTKHMNQIAVPSNKSTGPTAARTNTTTGNSLDAEAMPIDSHDVRDYTRKLRKFRKEEAAIASKNDGVKILRRALKKLPFQRTTDDINMMYKALKTLTEFSSMISNSVLRELCYVAQLECWKEEDFPVFGSSGMHLILKGSVESSTPPHLYNPNDSLVDFKRDFTNAKHTQSGKIDQLTTISVGECFGTFTCIDNTPMHKEMLMVTTAEPNCEFMKITTSDYSRVIEQMKTKEQTKKLNLLQACPPFKMWTRQPKLKIASLMEWQQFSPNTVVVSEGYRAPFIGFVLKGECHILKQLEVLVAQPNGEREKRTRQVVMGKIGPNESFSELSILKEEPMNCSIITATEVTLGTITPVNLYSLDQTTLDLLLQSCQPSSEQMSQEKIEEEYMEQEMRREWNQYRHNAVIEAINAQGIRPGYGKWSKN